MIKTEIELNSAPRTRRGEETSVMFMLPWEASDDIGDAWCRREIHHLTIKLPCGESLAGIVTCVSDTPEVNDGKLYRSVVVALDDMPT
jgi:hypothetical protein